jgi:hypothetical protein
MDTFAAVKNCYSPLFKFSWWISVALLYPLVNYQKHNLIFPEHCPFNLINRCHRFKFLAEDGCCHMGIFSQYHPMGCSRLTSRKLPALCNGSEISKMCRLNNVEMGFTTTIYNSWNVKSRSKSRRCYDRKDRKARDLWHQKMPDIVLLFRHF